jgi:DNA-binding NarL/FixJ family response regulator
VAGLSVLVVDDHQMVAEGLATVIREDPGVETVCCVYSGEDARRHVSERPPDVVVVDLRLPDVGGVDLVRQLRTACPSVRPVLISASFTREALDDAVAAGITALAVHRGGTSLTEREREVIQALADGRDVPEIAERLHLSQHTVRNHIRRSMQKLGVRRQLDAVVVASRLGYIEIGA